MTPSKARRVTQVQQEMLLQFMQENPEFAARRVANPLNRAVYDQKWEELAITLNGGGEGSQKSVAEWRKTWSDWRKNVRLKASGAKDIEGKSREGARNLTGVERRLLELVGAGTPPKRIKSTATPVTVTSTVAVPRPTVYALPQAILPPQPLLQTQQPSSFATVFPTPAICDDDVEVLEEIESDPESSPAAASSSKDGCHETSPQDLQFPRQATEPRRVGVGIAVEGGSRGGWRPCSLDERRLTLEERRLHLDERRLKLEERRVQHEEWRATMERESHEVDMDMKRALLKHMRRTETD